MGRTKQPAPPTEAIAYYRVSTQKQGASGLGLEAQRADVQAYAKAYSLTIVAEYTEIETGTNKRKRKEIFKALADAKARDAVLLIAKLDRLARNVHFISGLMESGVAFVAVDNPSVTPLTLHVLAAVAEQEAKMISVRTRGALAAAKARGTVIGTPANLTREAQLKGAQANADARRAAYSQLMNYAGMLRTGGLTFAAMAERLNTDGYKTRTGKAFTAMTVWRAYKAESQLA
jgi:DNA invertase Pin-like site-specific DNA recombinase